MNRRDTERMSVRDIEAMCTASRLDRLDIDPDEPDAQDTVEVCPECEGEGSFTAREGACIENVTCGRCVGKGVIPHGSRA